MPQRNGNKHASEIALMALDLQNCIEGLVIPHKPGTKMTLRIGMHTGKKEKQLIRFLSNQTAANYVSTKSSRLY